MATTYVVDRKSQVAGVVRDVIEIGEDYAYGRDSSVMGVDINEAKIVVVNTDLELEQGDTFPDEYGDDISDQFRKVNKDIQIDEMNTTIGTLLLESANDKATIASLEETVGTLLLELAALKGGAE
ncbi:hypothetical protein [Paenibacillus sp. DMB20]|uniref:hypothetical protein n=1 Tax=Paenibacillus sp. DMB20 TaxID=1642570 RepID=UPI000627D8E8|nr:hypothetical protein [Paenibacillus sp. DMB20]KKO50989.1 hypothetical protein XI25_28630 [Paenibacillus sp. DMB20]